MRFRHSVAIGVVITASAAGGWARAGAGDRTEPVIVRGEAASRDNFSFRQLHHVGDVQRLDEERAAVYDGCLRERGFNPNEVRATDGPGAVEDSAFSEAAIGDDGTATSPAAHYVLLPDGDHFTIYATWSRDSCIYKSFEAFGSEPFEREALRQIIQQLTAEADTAAVSTPRFRQAFEDWRACAGSAASEMDLLLAIDAVHGRKRSTPACMTSQIQRDVSRERSNAHYEAASRNHEVVARWVEVVDQEIQHSKF